MPQAGHIVATWADTGKVHMLGADLQQICLLAEVELGFSPKGLGQE